MGRSKPSVPLILAAIILCKRRIFRSEGSKWLLSRGRCLLSSLFTKFWTEKAKLRVIGGRKATDPAGGGIAGLPKER